jgi:Ser/Thr protein kinase RdoA (MazF antagonist)
LGVSNPRVLSTGSTSVIALEPLPVVARVCSAAHDQRHTSQEQQVALATFAAARGGPVVRPLAGVGGSQLENGFVVSLWERVWDVPAAPDAVGRSLRRLHTAIAAFPGKLPSFDPRPQIRRIAAELPQSAHEAAVVLSAACDTFCCPGDLPVQPLHGDVHFGNALGGGAVPLWNDFEYACVGPIEWDLASAAHQSAVFGTKVVETKALFAAYGADAAGRASALLDIVGLHMAAQTIGAVASRPALQPQALRRLEWVRQRLE